MTKLALIFALIVFPEVVLSQTTIQAASESTSSSAPVIRIVRVRHGDAHTLAELAHMNSVSIAADNAMQVIVLKGDAAQVAAMEQVIHQLDVPSTAPPSPRNVELTVSIISGSSNAESGAGVQMSDDMAPVINQLRAIFPYKNYQVLSSMLLRSREGVKAQSEGVMKSFSSFGSYSYPTVYTVTYDDMKSSVEAGKAMIHVRNFHCSMLIQLQSGGAGPPPQIVGFHVSVTTDVDLREGQKVVVGKANVENSDSAMFVVLMARQVE